jgi:hypothetical protein
MSPHLWLAAFSHNYRITHGGHLFMVEQSSRVSRRRLLQGMGALAALTVIPAFPSYANASDDSSFTKLSTLLTGKSQLPENFTRVLLAAFSRIDSSFSSKTSRLQQWIEHNTVSANEISSKLAADPSVADLAHLPTDILTGWYLGVVGKGDNAICVAYIEALANQVVADKLRPPTYAYGAYGSWAAQPL